MPLGHLFARDDLKSFVVEADSLPPSGNLMKLHE